MTIPASGPVDFFQLKSEFKPSTSNTSISLGELYSGGGYVKSGYSGIPASGTIGVNNFLGTSDKYVSAGRETMTAGTASYTNLNSIRGFTEVRSMATDKFGNVYVAGILIDEVTLTTNFLSYAKLSKFDTNGNLLWSKSIQSASASNTSFFNGVVIDDTDNSVYVSGSIDGATNINYARIIMKLDSSGNYLWSERFGSNTIYDVTNMGIDSSGNVYVSGSCQGGAINKNSIFARKYNSSGTLQWSRLYIPTQTTGTGNNLFDYNKMCVSASGNVYVLCYSDNSSAKVIIVKWNSSGTFQWTKNITTTYAQGGVVNRIVLDSSENMYLMGYANENYIPVAVYKFASDGTAIWANKYTFSGGVTTNSYAGQLSGIDLTIDPSGNLYLATTYHDYGTSPNVYENIIVFKTNSSGTPQFASIIKSNYSSFGTWPSMSLLSNPAITFNKFTNNYHVCTPNYVPGGLDSYGGIFGNSVLTLFKFPYNSNIPASTPALNTSLAASGSIPLVNLTVTATAISASSSAYAPTVGTPAETTFTPANSSTAAPTFTAKSQYDRLVTKI